MNNSSERICPQCKKGDLVERLNKKTGQSFYGCNRYPVCKFAVASLDRVPSEGTGPAGATPNVGGEAELAAAVRELASAIRALADASEGRDELTPDGGTTP